MCCRRYAHDCTLATLTYVLGQCKGQWDCKKYRIAPFNVINDNDDNDDDGDDNDNNNNGDGDVDDDVVVVVDDDDDDNRFLVSATASASLAVMGPVRTYHRILVSKGEQ